MFDSLIRQYAETYQGHKNGRWCYEDGCLYKGLAELWEATGDRWYLSRLIALVDRNVRADGGIDRYEPEEYALDNVQPGLSLFTLWDATGGDRYRLALDRMVSQLASHPRTGNGGFWHKKAYPWQIWLDGLYMALPLLLRHSLTFGDGAAVPDVRDQFAFVRRTLRDAATGLYYHGWDERRAQSWADPETGLSRCFWSRAMGWLMVALAEACDIVGPDHSDRPFYNGMLREMAGAVAPWQRADGLWAQVMDQPDRPGNYSETSCTAMFAYAFLKGARLGVLDGSYRGRAVTALAGIDRDHITCGTDGVWRMGAICGMAGLGALDGKMAHRDGSFAYYIGEPIVENDPKGVGPLCMAEAERRRLPVTAAGEDGGLEFQVE